MWLAFFKLSSECVYQLNKGQRVFKRSAKTAKVRLSSTYFLHYNYLELLISRRTPNQLKTGQQEYRLNLH